MVAVGAAGLLVGGLLWGASAMATRPTNLGVHSGRLSDCPTSPNCVCSQATDTSHAINPISYSASREEAVAMLKQVLATLPRMEIVEERPDYLWVEASTAIFRFVDDVEFLFDDEAKEIHVRSASRVGYSDLGANRRRIERVRQEFSRVSTL